MLTSSQCRAARALIDWSREDLAAASKVGLRTIVDFERDARILRIFEGTSQIQLLGIAATLATAFDRNGEVV